MGPARVNTRWWYVPNQISIVQAKKTTTKNKTKKALVISTWTYAIIRKKRREKTKILNRDNS